jgi:hypothetical protein
MRSFVVALGIMTGSVSASLAMPLAPAPIDPTPIQVHGCHRTYSRDLTGSHRHDRDCRMLRGVAARKNRAAKS